MTAKGTTNSKEETQTKKANKINKKKHGISDKTNAKDKTFVCPGYWSEHTFLHLRHLDTLRLGT